MAAFLLDTHALLWWLSDPAKLKAPAQQAIASAKHEVLVSAAAIWEMSIKKTLGRLEFPSNLEEALRDEQIGVLPVTLAHALAVAELPMLHQDPFDRMQIVQARAEDLTIITRDAKFADYDVRRLAC